jgi:phosphonate transport system substrate-binding protein
MRVLVNRLIVGAMALAAPCAWADDSLSFAVISQRSLILTAQHWNPILKHVSARSGVPLALRLAKTGPEHAAMVTRGEADFIYSNHNFTPENDTAGYRVIARPEGEPITGQIVVLEHSAIRSLAQLKDKEVVFPSRAAFVGYYVPMDALMRQGVAVSALFAGNQEGAMGQLKAGRAAAAAVNSAVMRDFARREALAYRVLWTSDPYPNIPISVHPRVSKHGAEAVREALAQMAADAEGAKILAASAELVKQSPPFGFVRATDADYDNVRKFHRMTRVQGD